MSTLHKFYFCLNEEERHTKNIPTELMILHHNQAVGTSTQMGSLTNRKDPFRRQRELLAKPDTDLGPKLVLRGFFNGFIWHCSMPHKCIYFYSSLHLPKMLHLKCSSSASVRSSFDLLWQVSFWCSCISDNLCWACSWEMMPTHNFQCNLRASIRPNANEEVQSFINSGFWWYLPFWCQV